MSITESKAMHSKPNSEKLWGLSVRLLWLPCLFTGQVMEELGVDGGTTFLFLLPHVSAAGLNIFMK